MKRIRPDKKTLEACKIYKTLREYANKRHISFHTPGHKAGVWDITELSFSDNLSCPRGVLKEAEEDIAQILGAAASFILTDGSTSGVFSMLKASGAKRLALPRLSHKSVFNGCSLLGIEPVFIDSPYLGKIPLPPTRYEVSEKLAAADALLVTSPDYYGNLADLASLSRLCAEEGKLFLVDGAHGGHLHFEKALYAGTYADLWVDGVHKSLPALTQGAVVSAKTPALAAKLRDAADMFRTTSPSYPIMASVEYAVKYPRNERLEREALSFAAAYPNHLYCGGDWTKLCASFGNSRPELVFAFAKSLEEQGIYPEFCDGTFVMFYLSPATSERDFRLLKKTLGARFETLGALPEENLFPSSPPSSARSPAPSSSPPLFESAGKETAWIPLAEAEQRICARTFGLFPPCTPLVFPGERIEKRHIELAERADNVFGLNDKQVCVFTKQRTEKNF